jgi:hypothetical protein
VEAYIFNMQAFEESKETQRIKAENKKRRVEELHRQQANQRHVDGSVRA